MPLQVARLVASSFALVAFALAIAVGLSAGNPTDAILTRALVALIAAAFGGYVVGLVCEHLVRSTFRKIDMAADEVIADEEAALHAALHPHAHAAHGAHDGRSDQVAARTSAPAAASARHSP